MKKRIPFPIFFLMVLLCTGTLLATAVPPTLVQIGGIITSSSTSPIPSFSATPGAGHFIACAVVETTGTLTTPSPGPSWTAGPVKGGAGWFYEYAAGTLPLTSVITNNPVGGNDPHIYCGEFSGVAPSPVVSAIVTTAPGGVTTVTPTLNPSSIQAEYEFGAVSQGGNTPSPSPSPSPSAGALAMGVCVVGTNCGNSGFFGYGYGGQYTGNPLPHDWTIKAPAGGSGFTLLNIDIEGNIVCPINATTMNLAGAGC